MGDTYSQIYIHYVFAVKGRECLLHKDWRHEVFQYIAAIIKTKNQKPIIVNGMSDHVHALVGLSTTISVSDLIRDVKNNSSKFINNKKYLKPKFEWQEGFGAFSYAHSQLDTVYKYILNQEQHHQNHSFKDEYIEMLKKFQVDYKEQYLFEWV
jgi:REP element-mobilizing transposase RayT